MATPATGASSSASSMQAMLNEVRQIMEEARKFQVEYLKISTPLKVGTDQARASRQS